MTGFTHSFSLTALLYKESNNKTIRVMIEKSLEAFEPWNGFVQATDFANVYPMINEVILCSEGWDESRDGKVKDILDFKTTILNPYRKLVGGQKRNINVFFLLAEAMWIFTGHKDVRFLTLFNKKMADFSDDGVVFHAPYGFRLRHWGVRSEDKFVEENMHAAQGYDQVADAIRIFQNNPNSRQVVMMIWNPDFDLGTNTKDIPCNDCVMMKIRNGKLYTTIQNRSNDLHWGLPTNIFQFGFLSEIMANILGVKLGTQTHNSQSLHIYDWNTAATTMHEEWVAGNRKTLYGLSGVREIPMDFKFSHEVPVNRLCEVNVMLERMIACLTRVAEGDMPRREEINDFLNHSHWFACVYRLLEIYLIYKREISRPDFQKEFKSDEAKLALEAIEDHLQEYGAMDWDIGVMARNFFANKIKNYSNSEMKEMGNL